MHLYVRVARKRTNICFPIHTERSSRNRLVLLDLFLRQKELTGGGCLSSTLARRYSRVPILRYLLLGFRSTGYLFTGYLFMGHQTLGQQTVGYQARSFIRFFITTFISSLWRWNSSLHAHICALRGKSTRFCQHAPDETHRLFVVGMRV